MSSCTPLTLASSLSSRPSTPEQLLDPAPSLPPAEAKRLLTEQKKLEQAERKRAKREEVAALKRAEGGKAEKDRKEKEVPLRFLPRKWSRVMGEARGEGEVSILTWNLLAQCLVRRELFPNSDFLKGATRIPTLMQEVLYYNPDIAVLQEVDRLSDHLPAISHLYSTTSYTGYVQKSHGLLVAYKTALFDKVGERTLRFDEMALREDERYEPTFEPPKEDQKEGEGGFTIHDPNYDPTTDASKQSRRAAGLSRSTRNVALIVALKFKNRPGGLIIGTTHLFWHPQHVYERARQSGLLLRSILQFRLAHAEYHAWPAFLAGDLNTQPTELTYRLIMGLEPTQEQEADLCRSMSVHESVDRLHDPLFISAPAPAPAPTSSSSTTTTTKEEGDGIHDGNLEQHPDRVIKNARPATSQDGLLDLEGIKALFSSSSSSAPSFSKGKAVRSAYGEAWGNVEGSEGRWYCDRKPEVQQGRGLELPEKREDVEARKQGNREMRVRRGDYEPQWSNFTPLWRCTLDYIFLLPPTSLATDKPSPRVTSLLEIHPTEAMGHGLPKMGVEPSDHIALGAVYDLPYVE